MTAGDGLAQVAVTPQVIPAQAVIPLFAGPGDRRDRPGLDHGQLARRECPLDVHRLVIQLFDGQTDPRQLARPGRGEHRRRPQAGRRGDRLGARAIGHGHRLLAARLVADQRPRHPVDDHDVGGNVTGHDGLAEAPVRANHDLVVPGADRIDGEHDAGRLREHELLHHDGDAHLAGLDAVPGAVTDGPRRPQRCPAPPDRVEHGRLAADVQVRVMLPSRGHAGQVLHGRRGPDRDRHVVAQARVGPGDRRHRRGRHGLASEQLTDARGGRVEGGRVGDVDGGYGRQHRLEQAPTSDEIEVRAGRHVEPGRDPEPGTGQPGQRDAPCRRPPRTSRPDRPAP